MSILCIDTYTQLILPLIDYPVKDAVTKAETLVNKTFSHEVDVSRRSPRIAQFNALIIRATRWRLQWANEVRCLCTLGSEEANEQKQPFVL